MVGVGKNKIARWVNYSPIQTYRKRKGCIFSSSAYVMFEGPVCPVFSPKNGQPATATGC